jgi:hypothetical protein
MESVNLTKIFYKHFCKCHNAPLIYTNYIQLQHTMKYIIGLGTVSVERKMPPRLS